VTSGLGSPGAASGILLIDKPGGMTSHDVVGRVRRALGTRKVGHAGTLDPMATGLLLLGVGSSTRLLTYLVGLDKEYTATIRLGAATDTDDAEGQVIRTVDASGVTRTAIDGAIDALRGELSQIPSTYSAIKVAGRRSYDRARAGEDVVLTPRQVTISRFDVISERREGQAIELDVVVACTSGTYIRALARDLGSALGVGGHLTALRRQSIGPFQVADAVQVADEYELARAQFSAALRAPAAIARELFPVAELDESQATDLAHGKRVDVAMPDAPVVAALEAGRLVGMVSVTGGSARVLVNFPAELPTDEVLP
jgi:tRNA pseudouridine55 synthase